MSVHADKSHKDKNSLAGDTSIQRKTNHEAKAQLKGDGPGAVAQRKAQNLANNSPQASQAIQLQANADQYTAQGSQSIQKKPNNTGLPDNLKAGIENLSGFSMDDVKVHYNSARPAQLQAHAYAQGTDIHLAPGQEQHLPHEAWHVVQQKQGRVKPTMQMKGTANINDDASLENEADVMGGKAMQMKADTVAQRVPISNSGAITTGNTIQLRPILGEVREDSMLYTSTLQTVGIRLAQGTLVMYDPGNKKEITQTMYIHSRNTGDRTHYIEPGMLVQVTNVQDVNGNFHNQHYLVTEPRFIREIRISPLPHGKETDHQKSMRLNAWIDNTQPPQQDQEDPAAAPQRRSGKKLFKNLKFGQNQGTPSGSRYPEYDPDDL